MSRPINNFRILFCLFISGSFLFYSCSDTTSAETAKDKTLKLLSKTWQVASVTVDGTDKTDLLPGFKLTLSSGQYSAQNGDPLWPASGTWTLTNDLANSMLRDDGVEIRIISVTESALSLSFDWDKTFGSGRLNSLGGNYVFELSN